MLLVKVDKTKVKLKRQAKMCVCRPPKFLKTLYDRVRPNIVGNIEANIKRAIMDDPNVVGDVEANKEEENSATVGGSRLELLPPIILEKILKQVTDLKDIHRLLTVSRTIASTASIFFIE